VYRDDPLDDEAELRAVVSDAAVDTLLATGGSDAVLVALDALRILQGWVDETACERWLTTRQRRLGEISPLEAIAKGRSEDVDDALRAFVAAQS
jgi:hypothetical protein